MRRPRLTLFGALVLAALLIPAGAAGAEEPLGAAEDRRWLAGLDLAVPMAGGRVLIARRRHHGSSAAVRCSPRGSSSPPAIAFRHGPGLRALRGTGRPPVCTAPFDPGGDGTRSSTPTTSACPRPHDDLDRRRSSRSGDRVSNRSNYDPNFQGDEFRDSTPDIWFSHRRPLSPRSRSRTHRRGACGFPGARSTSAAGGRPAVPIRHHAGRASRRDRERGRRPVLQLRLRRRLRPLHDGLRRCPRGGTPARGTAAARFKLRSGAAPTGWSVSPAGARAAPRPGFPGVYTRVADTTMSPLIHSDVAGLDATFGLPTEPIFGGLPVAAPARRRNRNRRTRSAKCKRIHNKKKRKRCIKRVEAEAEGGA